MSLLVASACIGLSVASYFAAHALIGSESIRRKFIKANLFGKDLNKKSNELV